MRRITLDIETTSAASTFDIASMELALIGIHDTEDDALIAFTVSELPALWPRIERADLLVGYNSDHFDIPILNKYYSGDLTKIRSIDLLTEIKNVLGRRLKLDSVAKATLGVGKSGHGLDAVKWWAEGKVEKVRKYCLDDVRITKEIYEHALKFGRVSYDDFGQKREIPLDTAHWERPSKDALTHTLPF
jgi:DEAD/DEAH box helicase domain-containing protein